jgi:hypothetical protein
MRPKKRTHKNTLALRGEVYRRAFAKFQSWYGLGFKRIYAADPQVALVGFRSIYAACLQVLKEYDLSLTDHAAVVDGFSVHVWAKQYEVNHRTKTSVVWRNKHRQYVVFNLDDIQVFPVPSFLLPAGGSRGRR